MANSSETDMPHVPHVHGDACNHHHRPVNKSSKKWVAFGVLATIFWLLF
jgi:hypothetical protein